MKHAAALDPRTPRAWGDWVLVMVIGVAGILMAHAPMILSGFRKLQVDLGDSRLIHYLLEHGSLWIRGAPGHREFWNPPFFYPAPNAAAYTDVFLTVGPPYWIYRAAGISLDLSFGLWMVTMSVLNYAAGMVLFRKGLRLGVLPSAAGSFLIAFGAPRINQMAHQQLLPCFYVLMAVYALARLFGDHAPGRAARWIYWLTAALGCVLQFYAGVYLAWFLTLGAGITAVIAVALPSCRGAFLKVLKRDMWCIFAATAVGMLSLLPLVTHYQPVNREVTIHRYMPAYRHLHPDFGSWLDVGPGNWVWGWAEGWRLFRLIGVRPEHHLGIGLITTIACLCGLYLGRQWPICRLAAAVWLALCLATTFMPSDTLTLAATGLAFLCMTGLYRDVGKPGERASGLAVVLGILLFLRFPGEHLQALGIGVIVLCLLEIFRGEAEPESRIIAAVALALVCLKLFAIEVMPTAIAFSAAVSAPLALLLKRRRRTIGLVATTCWLAFLVVITYLDHPKVPLIGLAAVGASLVASTQFTGRLPARRMVQALLFALPIIVIYYGADSLWLRVYASIPGGVGIRAVGRVVLIVLIPAALGLATLVQKLQSSGLRVASGLLVLACMIEQGTTTPSYDAAESRAGIEAVARRVDLESETFYYRPCDHRDWVRYQIDAMWASLASGKPTVNGYSGYHPPGWAGFFMVDTPRGPSVEDVLEEWTEKNGLRRDKVQWIGEECPETNSDAIVDLREISSSQGPGDRLPSAGVE